MKDETFKYLHDIKEAALAIFRFVDGKGFGDACAMNRFGVLLSGNLKLSKKH